MPIQTPRERVPVFAVVLAVVAILQVLAVAKMISRIDAQMEAMVLFFAAITLACAAAIIHRSNGKFTFVSKCIAASAAGVFIGAWFVAVPLLL